LPEIVCNTSPIQYLHQLGLLHILPALARPVTVPPAVLEEINAGRKLGLNLPDLAALDWIKTQRPASFAALPLVTDLGPGEAEVLALTLETKDAIAVLDDALARQVAETLRLPLTGTLGLLLDAKRHGLISTVGPLLEQLDALGFRVASRTRAAVLKLAGERGGL
jgi:predicted nucleic acid-binding protein